MTTIFPRNHDEEPEDAYRPWELGQECPHPEWYIAIWRSAGDLGDPVVLYVACPSCHARQRLEWTLNAENWELPQPVGATRKEKLRS
jgi:hypothetical protein